MVRYFLAGLVTVALLPAVGQADEDAVAPPARRWAGSSISLAHYIGVTTFAPGVDLTYNPHVGQALSFDPRWQLGGRSRIALLAHLDVSTELTDSDVTSYERQPLLSDFWVTAARPLPRLPGGLEGTAALRLVLPTSRESRARERLFALRASGSLGRAWPVGGGDIVLKPILTLSASGIAATARSLTYDAPTITTCRAEGGSCAELDHSGARSSVAVLEEGLALTATFPHRLTAVASMTLVQQRLYALDEITNPVTGEPVPPSEVNTNWRHLMLYVLGVDWKINERFTVGGGLQTITPQQKPDSTTYAPFFNRHTQVYVTTSVVF